MYWPVAVWLLLRLLSSHLFMLLLFRFRRRALREARFRTLRLRDFRGLKYSGKSAGFTGCSSDNAGATWTATFRADSGSSLISLI
mmetsp:Transcript_136373/g.192872  ORF Transcript_136373/g.192872 Transcript_136373/m.192872 type:complete len:85 (-) Transcript_136373:704-958(-)